MASSQRGGLPLCPRPLVQIRGHNCQTCTILCPGLLHGCQRCIWPYLEVLDRRSHFALCLAEQTPHDKRLVVVEVRIGGEVAEHEPDRAAEFDGKHRVERTAKRGTAQTQPERAQARHVGPAVAGSVSGRYAGDGQLLERWQFRHGPAPREQAHKPVVVQYYRKCAHAGANATEKLAKESEVPLLSLVSFVLRRPKVKGVGIKQIRRDNARLRLRLGHIRDEKPLDADRGIALDSGTVNFQEARELHKAGDGDVPEMVRQSDGRDEARATEEGGGRLPAVRAGERDDALEAGGKAFGVRDASRLVCLGTRVTRDAVAKGGRGP
jgi:hypothetical protein